MRSGFALLGQWLSAALPWLVAAGVLLVAAVASLTLSLVAYWVVSALVVPAVLVHEQPLVFAVHADGLTREANVSLGGGVLSRHTSYRLLVHLVLPEAPANVGSEHALDVALVRDATVVFHTARNVAVVWKSWGRLWMERIAWALPLVLGWVDEAQRATVVVAEGTALNVDYALLSYRAPLLVTSARVSFQARLEGLAFVWHHWRVSVFVVFVSVLWAWLFTCCACAVLCVLVRRGADELHNDDGVQVDDLDDASAVRGSTVGDDASVDWDSTPSSWRKTKVA